MIKSLSIAALIAATATSSFAGTLADTQFENNITPEVVVPTGSNFNPWYLVGIPVAACIVGLCNNDDDAATATTTAARTD